ncbi:hypothetical protein [Pleomorphomonas sp. JP5]|uniref:hypothetical protein n=1 Tax=Pleomorphomonas sp. JP5 TaxID=2942998 RepID=UPI0020435916|nr:hypothetical protein [Pleomorphomonas sp. JP5]MCM5556243.1 hypothetical protein [Pleomorphomonas sp. JP5]
MKLAAALLATIAVGVGILGYQTHQIIGSVPYLFHRNAELKADGYYMAEFEFRMLSIVKKLSDGDYLDAYSTLRRLRRQMESGEGLIKMPADKSAKARYEFLLARQDQTTGAFMDPDYPSFTFIAPTLNVIEALDGLAREVGEPLRLRYPLRFLDRIATPEALRAYLDAHLYIGRFWAEHLPGPGVYGPGISELAYVDLLETTGTYHFTPAWHAAFRSWLDATQDPKSGMWGARMGTPRAFETKRDANSTYHILHYLLTDDGADRDPSHPLLYASELASSLMGAMAAPMPTGEDEQHAWSLEQAQATQLLTRHLWGHLDEAGRAAVRSALEVALTERYRLLDEATGGFAIYPGSPSDVDGTTTALRFIEATGSLPGTADRVRLWGDIEAPAVDSISVESSAAIELPDDPVVNSFRLYVGSVLTDTDRDQPIAVLYPPNKGAVLDVIDLRQSVGRFLASAGASFGNWSTADSIRGSALHPDSSAPIVPVMTIDRTLGDALGDIGKGASDLLFVGYDVFQRPVFARHCHIEN